MTTVEATPQPQERILDRLLGIQVRVDAETIAYTALILLTVFTRFYDLDTRVMSHDESLHTYFSYQLEQGRGFQHTPLMHGPLQFHLVALSYFLLGDSDASARVPAAIAGVLSVGLLYLFRRWLGKTGALVAATLMAFSPYMLYYSRYVRNESLIVPMALVMAYAIFRYFEDRRARWLYILTAALTLHFTAKETSFIYTAQVLVFFAGVFIVQLWRSRWTRSNLKWLFLAGILAAIPGAGALLFGIFSGSTAGILGQTEVVEPADPTVAVGPPINALGPVATLGLGLTILGAILILASLLLEFGRRLRTDFPSLDILVVATTITLPQLAAIPALVLGWNPIDYQNQSAVLQTGIVLGALIAVSVAIGLAWDWRRWLVVAGIFLGIFTVFYTTLFTYSFGLFTGLVGSVGYWLEQHGVRRGSQPWYYYLLIQVPIYEFLPAIGALMAAYYGFRRWWRGEQKEGVADEKMEAEASPGGMASDRFSPILFLGYWALTSLAAYTFAGERMPWLTVHITLPLILLAGWAIGRYLESIDWPFLATNRGWAVAGLLLLALLAALQALGYLLGTDRPFAGAELSQLRSTMGFLSAAGVALGAALGLGMIARAWPRQLIARVGGALALGLLMLLTARAAFRASFIHYDQASEYLVYAHAATGVKTVMDQVEELSMRTTDSMAIDVGYDDDVSWPFSWYLRNFTQSHYYAASPSRDLQNYPIVIAGDNNWAKVEPVLANRYHSFEYIRMWWPMQDYFDLTWERIWNALRSPEYRAALWDIWLNRDYEAYGVLTGKDFSLRNWSPSDRMRLYIRKDIAAQIWDYGVTAAALEEVEYVDPYADRLLELAAGWIIGQGGAVSVDLNAPRDIAVAPDGSLYVADTGNHRILHLSVDGRILNAWGQFADAATGSAPGGTFNEPWGIGVAEDGTVYVADTWNHRVQAFTPSGEFLRMWGFFGQAETPDAFWGPRDVAISSDHAVLVSDTGNKRIVVFDREGNALGSFGGIGLTLGEFDEAVGLGFGPAGRLFVADTWNQRIQLFESAGAGDYSAVAEWSLDGWYGQSLQNKPYLDVHSDGSVCTSDPEGFRVLCFNAEGEFLVGWGVFGASDSQFALPIGVAFDDEGRVWVVDSGNNRLMRFEPELP